MLEGMAVASPRKGHPPSPAPASASSRAPVRPPPSTHARQVAEELADTEWMADHHKKVVPQNAKITKAQKQANKDAAKQQEQMNQEVEHVS